MEKCVVPVPYPNHDVKCVQEWEGVYTYTFKH